MRRCTFSTLLTGIGLSLLFVHNLAAQCSLSCNENQINIALDQDGISIITPEMFVEGTSGTCTGTFSLNLIDQFNNNIGNTATCDYLNSTLTARYTHDDSGNFCESILRIEDKLRPSLICPNDTIHCSAPTDTASIATVVATDNCTTMPLINYTETIDISGQCSASPFLKTITRTFIAFDAQNQESEPCVQEIFIQRAQTSDIVFPPNYDNIEEAMFNCTASYPTEAETGRPLLFGDPIGAECKLELSFEDLVIEVCDGTYKIFREWTVLNCCTQDIINHTQFIKVGDANPPIPQCPDPISVAANEPDCTGDILLPTIAVEDECSATITTRIFSPFGTINTNGGMFENIPAGDYDFTYQFTDACGNDTTCVLNVTLADMAGPTMICEEFTDISLGTSGLGVVDAINFDEGSFDACCTEPLLFEIKRLEEADTEFAAQDTFTCADIGIQQITLRGTDCNGFSTTCNIMVEIEEKTPPVILCPGRDALPCTEYPAPPIITGEPMIFDNCGEVIYEYSDDLTDFDTLCKIGTVIRIFTAIDAQGLTASCSQIINYEDVTPLLITYPQDTVLNSCDFDEIGTQAGTVSTNADCEIISVSIDDDVFEMDDEDCEYKIMRTFTVMNNCTGEMESGTQEIIVTDTSPPVFEANPGELDVVFDCNDEIEIPSSPPVSDLCSSTVDVVIESSVFSDAECPETYMRTITFRATDECGNISRYTATMNITDTTNPEIECPDNITVPETGNCTALVTLAEASATDDCSDITITNNSSFALFAAADATGTYPLDTTIVVFTATDDCGNADTCHTRIVVNDISGPNMSCNSPLTIFINPTTSLAILDPNLIDAGSSDVCSSPINLTLDTDTFTCEQVGTAPHLVTLTGIDAAGNSLSCQSNIFVVDNADVCSNERMAISAGTIRRTTGEVLKNIQVTLQDPLPMGSCMSDTTGLYHFVRENEENACKITPYHDAEHENGVTTWDLIMIKRHILNMEKLDSPYKIIAADVNNSGSVTMADIVEAKRLILGFQDEFLYSASWRFIPADYIFADPENPFEADSTAPDYLMTSNVWEELDLDFIAIKVGDVNNTAE